MRDEIEGIEFSEVVTIPIDHIKLHPQFIHRVVDPEDRAALEQDVKLNGVLQPVYVQKIKSGFYLLNGERRLNAARKAGFKQIPARLAPIELPESQRRRIMHGANLLQEKYSAEQVAKAIVIEYGPERVLTVKKGPVPESVPPGTYSPLWREIQADFCIHSRRTVFRYLDAARRIAERENPKPAKPVHLELPPETVAYARRIMTQLKKELRNLERYERSIESKLTQMRARVEKTEKELLEAMPSGIRGSRAEKIELMKKYLERRK